MALIQTKKSAAPAAMETTAPGRLVLLITVVQKGKGTFFTDFLQQAYGANMQIAIVGNGTAQQNLVEFLGLKDNKRSVIFSVVREDRVDEILVSLEDRFHTVNRGTGVAFTVPLTSVVGKLAYAFMSDERSMLKED
mgnify:CR=1 FL=1